MGGDLFRTGDLTFAVGIEDTFVPQEAVGRRALDEYHLTEHYQRWHQDLELARECGATAIRYGFPWYQLNPERGRFEWGWADRVVDRLEELGLETIVDLVHYGTPLWLDNQFLNQDYPQVVAEYAGRLADRYRGRLRAYTPLNEPLINASFCGEIGRWPPCLTGHDGFVKLVRALVQGIVATQRAIVEATGGEATFIHVEATFRYAGAVKEFADEVEFLRARCFLVEDLLTGRVGDDHPLAGYLRAHGFGDEDLAWCADNAAHPDVMGINYYPHLTTAEYVAGEGGPLQQTAGTRRRIYGGTDGLEELIRAFSGRYGRPIFVTETSMAGSVEARLGWLEDSVALVRRLRDEGVAVVGYTWWPLFSLVDWKYREETRPVADYLVLMGMYDLVPDGTGLLERVPTAIVDRFRAHTDAW